MNRREIELIIGLAEGILEDETEARALIDFSPEARTAYQQQLQAMSALSSLPSSDLTDSEKSALGRDVWTALTTTETTTPSPAPRPGWQWAYAAAALFVVVGLVSAMNLLGGGFSDGAATFAEAEQATTGAQTGAPPVSDDALQERLRILASQARTGTLRLSRAEQFSGLEREQLESCLREAGVEGQRVVGAFTDGGVEYLVVVPEDSELGLEAPLAFVVLETCQLALSDD